MSSQADKPAASQTPTEPRPASGRLGVMLPGVGAVATTFIAGVAAVRKGLGQPVGSLSQLQTIRLGRRAERRSPMIRDFVPLSDLGDLVFGGWDLHGENALQVARRAAVLEPALLDQVADDLAGIEPYPAVFDPEFVKRLSGDHVKSAETKRALGEALREDIRDFKRREGCERIVVIWCGSTEAFLRPGPVHETLAAFEAGLDRNDPGIAPSMIYAWAALKEGCPYANGAPNLTLDIPAITELAEREGLPVAGKDFKTGQTLMKTVLAPMLKVRALGVAGWFSTNILGNRDGEVLDDPASFKTKEESKLGVLEQILQPEMYPDLYGDLYHKVRINYYPPRGDAKEGWDNIDLFGWLGYPMQLKLNFLCRDSILAAPIVLDLALFLDLSARAGLSGVQEWLSFYFKNPQSGAPDVTAENDLFLQHRKLKNTLRWIGGEEPLTHLGSDD
jgi:myo-inositol-1-phosphate synthase